jgi:excisionase family DNA binding protein
MKSSRATIEPPLRVQTAEAARRLGVNMRTVQLMAGRGEIPGAAKIGNAWTFSIAKLHGFIEAKEAECAARAVKPIVPRSAGCERPRGAAAIEKAYDQAMLRMRGGKQAMGSWSAKRRARQGRPPAK